MLATLTIVFLTMWSRVVSWHLYSDMYVYCICICISLFVFARRVVSWQRSSLSSERNCIYISYVFVFVYIFVCISFMYFYMSCISISICKQGCLPATRLTIVRTQLYLYFICICINLCNPCWPTMFLAGCCVRDHLYCFHFRPCPEPQCPHLPPYADHSRPPTLFILSHCHIVCL